LRCLTLSASPQPLRRTVVRELERAGISCSLAVKLMGHKTDNIYSRDAIVAEADLAEGVARRAKSYARTRTLPAQSADLGSFRGRGESA
jgi:hypothetical protein